MQSIDRTIVILQHLAAADAPGARLLDVQKSTGLARPTVHRILSTLMRHGLVAQDSDTRRYRLGWEAAVLGWSVLSQMYDLREISQPELYELAQQTGDTAFLTVRSGYDTVCIERLMGPYPIRAFTVGVGTRRPLGVGAGGVALLASLDVREAEEVFTVIRPRIAGFPRVSEAAIRAAVSACRKKGYAVSDGLVMLGIRGMGVAIRDPKGWPAGALSVAAIRERIDGSRVPKLLDALQSARAGIERRLARLVAGTYRR